MEVFEKVAVCPACDAKRDHSFEWVGRTLFHASCMKRKCTGCGCVWKERLRTPEEKQALKVGDALLNGQQKQERFAEDIWKEAYEKGRQAGLSQVQAQQAQLQQYAKMWTGISTGKLGQP